jgi:uncharacterized protein (TIGR02271 family)
LGIYAFTTYLAKELRMYDKTSNASQTIAAIFDTVDEARQAAAHLKDAGYDNVWIGISKNASDSDSAYEASTNDAVEADNWFQRLFGEGNETLHDALVRHGVSEAEAASAGALGMHAAVLTVDGANHPEDAAQILSVNAGKLMSSGFGATGHGTSGHHALQNDETAAAQNYGRFRAGEELDDTQRLRLREERLRVATERHASREAQVGKRVIEKQEEFDVPVSHEEFFIQRRPITNDASEVGTISGEREIVRIPLSEERLRVSKDTVATEEVVIGKRSVTELEHVSEKTRKEVLDIEDQPEIVSASSSY